MQEITIERTQHPKQKPTDQIQVRLRKLTIPIICS